MTNNKNHFIYLINYNNINDKSNHFMEVSVDLVNHSSSTTAIEKTTS